MDECPLCGVKLDDTDKNFRPCPCKYQVCSFCFNKLINDKEIDPKCPACRQPYNLKKIKFTPPPNTKLTSSKNVKKKKKKESMKKKEKEKEKEEILIKNRKELEDVRVLQRNLVYITNIPLSLAKEEILKKYEYFGQYGNITKIVVNKGKFFNTTAPGGPSVSAYVTFDKKRLEDTYYCILAVDGCWLENRTLRASYGTTKYCSYFLKGITCTNSNCMYLHDLGRKEDTFTKEEMSQGKHLIDTNLQFDSSTIPKQIKPTILPPPGVIAKELPKEKRKKGIFDPNDNEKKEINIKLPQKVEPNPSQEKTVEEVTEKLENTKLTEENNINKENENVDEEESEGEEEGSEEDSEKHSSEENKKEEEPVPQNEKKPKTHYRDLNPRYKNQQKQISIQRRKPSGEVGEEIFTNNYKPRKQSDHSYESLDYNRQDPYSRRFSDISQEKNKNNRVRFDHNNTRGKNSYSGVTNKPRSSDNSFMLPTISDENDFSFPTHNNNNIWSTEENTVHPRHRSTDEYNAPTKRMIPPYQEMEGEMRGGLPPYLLNPNYPPYGYHPSMGPQYGPHYVHESKGEERGSFGKVPPQYGQNYPTTGNMFYKQKPSPNDVFWSYPHGGYVYPPNQYAPPNVGYNLFSSYPNYGNFPQYPQMYQPNPQEVPTQTVPSVNSPQVEKSSSTSGTGQTTNNTNTPNESETPNNQTTSTNVSPNTSTPNTTTPTTTTTSPPNTTIPPITPTPIIPHFNPSFPPHNPLFPPHYNQPPQPTPPLSKHHSSAPTIHQMPLFFPQRGTSSQQESFSEHLLNRNYQHMMQNPMYQQGMLPPPYSLFPPTSYSSYLNNSFLTGGNNFAPPNTGSTFSPILDMNEENMKDRVFDDSDEEVGEGENQEENTSENIGGDKKEEGNNDKNTKK